MEESVAHAASTDFTTDADQVHILRCALCSKTFYRGKRPQPGSPASLQVLLCWRQLPRSRIDSGLLHYISSKDAPVSFTSTNTAMKTRTESTLKRHGYYCRTRNGIRVPRSRACLSCVSTKTRCDNIKPSCSRCRIKGLDCRYPARAIRTGGMYGLNLPWTQETPETVSETHSMPAATGHDGFMGFQADATDDVVLNETLLSHQAMQMSEAQLENWDGIDWQSLLSSPNSFDDAPFSTSLSPKTALDSETPISFDSWNSIHRVPTTMATMMGSRKSQIPRMPTFSMPAMFRRQHIDVGAQRVSQLMFQTLNAYPLMMMRQRTPPPFLHPSILADGANDILNIAADNLEPWHNCMSLVYMANSKMKGSKRLFWRNVRTECERFCHRVGSQLGWTVMCNGWMY